MSMTWDVQLLGGGGGGGEVGIQPAHLQMNWRGGGGEGGLGLGDMTRSCSCGEVTGVYQVDENVWVDEEGVLFFL